MAKEAILATYRGGGISPRLMTIGWPGLDRYRPRGGRSGGRWIPLPVEGSRLERCYIETSGKEAEWALPVACDIRLGFKCECVVLG